MASLYRLLFSIGIVFTAALCVFAHFHGSDTMCQALVVGLLETVLACAIARLLLLVRFANVVQTRLLRSVVTLLWVVGAFNLPLGLSWAFYGDASHYDGHGHPLIIKTWDGGR